ncbi:YhfX family PLP-dependent enzyme [Brassicibacter mesophilus]|uniref:YhfX family PLP-dependent enzyme n=1 Tax=Brassicibacter mesophilus TaxID=745119 RepID=UPI003D1D03FA
MFLDMTLKRNPQLIEVAANLHSEGKIYPNTYVLDVDAIKSNVEKLVKEADKHNIKLYMMTKQIGRNPDIAKIIQECGIDKAVAVDAWEAITLGRAGIKLGNVGHLVQIPTSMINEILSYKPEVITVFTVEKAAQISYRAQKMRMTQDILLKVVGKNDMIYEGQTGGFKESELIEAAKEINKLSGVRIVGVTAFPCFLYDQDKGTIIKTENANTLVRSAERLVDELGLSINQINAPSATTIASLPLLEDIGATHGEPGHGLTGTTPLHAFKNLDEKPAMVYVSEVSHYFDGKAYTYGGGFYRRSKMRKALIGKSFTDMKDNIVEAEEPSLEAIDYYGALNINDKKVDVGDTVIYAFRTQIFVTRSEVALVKGIQTGNPEILGIYDSLGKKLR